ncbi:MAG TPA: hypothetical protein VFP42_09415 [Acidimicrobiia bacterium]|nr:hypothetical protein [Acidimicrobiia bacterium]
MATFTLGDYQVEVAEEFGPRITGLRHRDREEVLVSLGPEPAIEHAGGVFRFRGGHRLWASPEIATSTYASDDQPCSVIVEDGSLTVTAPPDGAGLVKTITVTPDGNALQVGHSIERDHEGVVAAWGITQLPLGGTALIPLDGPDTSPLPNRTLVLWPYTDLHDPRIHFGRLGVEIDAGQGDDLKLGTPGWRSPLGYLRNGQLFTKEIVSSSSGVVPDFGASHQVYVGQGFCELETVGGQIAGGPARLTERWQVRPCADIDQAWTMLSRAPAV